VAGVLFAVSLVLLLAVRLRPLPDGDRAADGATGWRQLVDGLRYIRRHRVLFPLMIVIAVAEFGFSGPANIGLVLLAQERGWGASGMGWIIAGFGVGAGAASLLVAVRGRIGRAGAALSWLSLVGAGGLAGLAYVPSVAVAALVGAVTGAVLGLAGALCGALLQTVSDPACLGRVTSVSTLFTLGVAPLCYPLVGAAVGVWGCGPVFVVGAAICGASGVLGLGFGALRRAELPK
ncbi:MFS transporter, partial [Streptomyces sp. T-3]|nr:MFS transporter [Streptomyces sp. T-3]